MKYILIGLFLFCNNFLFAQMMSEHQDFFNAYEQYRESSINHKKFKHRDILPLIQKLKSPFEVKTLGQSVEGRARISGEIWWWGNFGAALVANAW